MAKQNRLNKLNNLQQRLIAGISGSALILFAIAYNKWTFFAMFLLISMSCLYEFYRLIKNVANPNVNVGLLIGAFNLYITYSCLFLNDGSPKWFILNFPIVSLIFLAELYRKSETPFQNIAFTILGVIYIIFPFCLMFFSSYHIGLKDGSYSYQFVIGAMLMLWANDTGAYAAGRAFGRTKLFERVSPKKTWEGTIGGMILSLCFAIGVAYWFNDLALNHWLVLCFIIVTFGSYGDLVESLLKRSIDIKDSGSIIPGHGGFLDRFDALLLALPFMAGYILLFVK